MTGRYKIRGPYDKEVKLEVTAIECSSCGDIVFSRANHDFRRCTCGECAIDGGFEYTKTVGASAIKPFMLKIVQTKQELYNDWNTGEDKYGLIKNKVYRRYKQENTGYGRHTEISERKRARNGFDKNGNRPAEVAKTKLRKAEK